MFISNGLTLTTWSQNKPYSLTGKPSTRLLSLQVSVCEWAGVTQAFPTSNQRATCVSILVTNPIRFAIVICSNALQNTEKCFPYPCRYITQDHTWCILGGAQSLSHGGPLSWTISVLTDQ